MIAERPRSAKLFEAAERVIPGGVNSPVRAFRGVGGTPRFISSGSGPTITDADGKEYVDYVMSWGALALGHAHPAVVRAITDQAGRGTSFGAPTELETELAELVVSALPSVEMVRFVSSGTEATMSALRLARAATGRSKILKFDGCYHGHADALLVTAGSGVASLGLPGTAGVTQEQVASTISVAFNDLAAVEAAFAAYPAAIAAVMVEPVAGNMGLVLPVPGFLDGLRRLCTAQGALLIFDEVMTGFRVAWGGAQLLYDVTPDLTCLGKVIGGGLPAAAYGGRRDLMQLIAPAGPVYQAGTLSGNPLAMAAGIATLRELATPRSYDRLGDMSRNVTSALADEANRAGVPIQTAAVGGMWGLFFAREPVVNYASAKTSNVERFKAFFHAMLDAGVYLAPSAFEAAFVSTAHDATTLERTCDAFASALTRLKQ